MSCLSVCCHVFLPTLLPFIKSGRFFFGKNSIKSVEFRRTLLLRCFDWIFRGILGSTCTQVTSVYNCYQPFLGGEGRGGDFRRGREGGESFRLSRPLKKRKSKHESGIIFTSSEFLLPFTQTVSLSI